ncbi:phosphopentomutase [Desulfuromonas versatilis]|uniref:Phosphopentomutase n=1 Tax=Desulfuromonas versatilis TaxID=2802975 RepID=A0ABM8HUI9_9BACT|nr:phosphopentomutase [Desulfuromonas versatilis]BCR04393.1 phosphopentomutase [Desulfuromonas versatilis]
MTASQINRVVLITLDGVGVGALPDAAAYGDGEANTLLHVARACGGLKLPNLQRLGLGNILEVPGVGPVALPEAAWGRMRERSVGKDTTTGHWEIAGLVQTEALPTYPEGFPEEIIAAFERETGLRPLGNIAASGTDILVTLGEEHLASGRPIVYTSADSVFQIAAHEEVIPVQRLYELCRIAREILNPYRVGRVIARPFLGSCAADFQRTARRHDFSLPPTGTTILDRMAGAGLEVFGVGKIRDIFAGRGVTGYQYSESNADGMAKTLASLEDLERGLVFTNLVDFDMLYGHRRDARGFGGCLEEFDLWLPRLLEQLGQRDLVILTADHGCDPTTAGTDHTREYVPLMIWSKTPGWRGDLGERESFAEVAATIAQVFGLERGPGKGVRGDCRPRA